MRHLGTTQFSLLERVVERGSWQWGCGWYWKSRSHDEKVFKSLVLRGFVREEVASKNLYGAKTKFTVTDAGRKYHEENKEIMRKKIME